MSSIKAAERMGEEDAAAADATRKEYLAAAADGSVRRMQGDPSYGATMPQAEENTWEYPTPTPNPNPTPTPTPNPNPKQVRSCLRRRITRGMRSRRSGWRR